MEVRAKLSGMRGSARKARLVADQIRGKGVEDALVTLDFSDKRAARPMAKLLRSALANAEQKNEREKARDRRRQPGGSHLAGGRRPEPVADQPARAGPGVLGSEAFAPHHRGAGRALEGQKMGTEGSSLWLPLGILYGWQSNWISERRYAPQLHEDVKIRSFIKKKLFHAGISKVVIERTGEKVVINIHTARPGILIGKRGAEVDALRKELAAYTAGDVFINIKEIRKAELDAQLVAENVAMQLERRVAFRRAMKKAVTATMKFGAQGVRIQASGRLGAQKWVAARWYREGRVPLHTLRRRHRVRARRSEDDLRIDRREVLDLQG